METMQITLAHDVPGLGRMGETVELRGETVNLALTPGDVRTAEEISTYVGGYRNGIYRADEVSPIVLVDKDSGYYRTFSSNNAFKLAAVKGESGKTNEIDPESSVAAYQVIPRKIGSFIDARITGSASTYDAMQAASRLCKNVIDLSREYDVFRTLLGTNTNWDSTVRTAISGNDIWNDGSTSNPIRDVQAAIEKSAQPVTGIWFNQKVANTFLRHSEVRNHMRQMLGDAGVSGAIAKVNQAASQNVDFTIPGLPPFHVAASKWLNSSEALEYVLANVVILVHTPSVVPDDGTEISSSYTFRQRGPDGTGYYVRMFRVEDRGALGGEMVIVTTLEIEKHTSTIAGGIITGIIG